MPFIQPTASSAKAEINQFDVGMESVQRLMADWGLSL